MTASSERDTRKRKGPWVEVWHALPGSFWHCSQQLKGLKRRAVQTDAACHNIRCGWPVNPDGLGGVISQGSGCRRCENCIYFHRPLPCESIFATWSVSCKFIRSWEPFEEGFAWRNVSHHCATRRKKMERGCEITADFDKVNSGKLLVKHNATKLQHLSDARTVPLKSNAWPSTTLQN